MKKFYATFRQATKDRDGYVIIEARSREEAQESMFLHYGRDWANLYDTAEEAGVEEFGLRCIARIFV